MRLEPLYRVEFDHPEGWSVELAGDHGRAGRAFSLAEGSCTIRVAGRARGANHSRERYQRLDDVVCVGTGEVRSRADGSRVDRSIDLADLIWEPAGDGG